MHLDTVQRASRFNPALPAVLLTAFAVLAGCAQLSKDPEARTVEILRDRGFEVTSDGRGTPDATLMSFTGPAAGKIECSADGTSFSNAVQDLDFKVEGVPFDGRQRGTVSAQVVVEADGRVSGLFVNAIRRDFVAGDTVLGSQIEVVEMRPGEAKALSSGQLCRPRI